MQENRERWMELAALASKEQDPHKLLALVQEINQLLAEKEKPKRIESVRGMSRQQQAK